MYITEWSPGMECWSGVLGWIPGMKLWSGVFKWNFGIYFLHHLISIQLFIKSICLCNQFDDTFNANIGFHDFLWWLCWHTLYLSTSNWDIVYHNDTIQILFRLSYTLSQPLTCYHFFLIYFVHNQLYCNIVALLYIKLMTIQLTY
jgi:hypothetical protein